MPQPTGGSLGVVIQKRYEFGARGVDTDIAGARQTRACLVEIAMSTRDLQAVAKPIAGLEVVRIIDDYQLEFLPGQILQLDRHDRFEEHIVPIECADHDGDFGQHFRLQRVARHCQIAFLPGE
jgi:hypothetical protein